MEWQQSSKSGMGTGVDVDEYGIEMRPRGKHSGTDADLQDMRMLGKTQQLNVSAPDIAVGSFPLTKSSAIFGLYPRWALPVP